MKGLFNLLHSLFNVGQAGYDPELHRFTLHHLWVATRLYLAALLLVALTLYVWSKVSQRYAERCLKSGNQRASRGDQEGAIRCYTDAIKWSQDYSLAYHNRGLAKIVLGQVEKAKADFEHAHALDASLPVLAH
jgi:tetratricopeptide (TPR) repeat protein